MKRRELLPYWIFVGVGLVVIVFGVVFAQRFGVDPTLVDSPLIGEQAGVVQLSSIDDDTEWNLASSEGNIVVLNFWASWCLACRTEHQALVEASAVYADDLGVDFVGALVQDQPFAGVSWLDEMGRGDGWIYVNDDGSRASLEFGVLGVPETFFIDRDGTIVGKVSGPVNGAILAQTIEAIALGEADDIGVVKTGEVENR